MPPFFRYSRKNRWCGQNDSPTREKVKDVAATAAVDNTQVSLVFTRLKKDGLQTFDICGKIFSVKEIRLPVYLLRKSHSPDVQRSSGNPSASLARRFSALTLQVG